MDALRNTCDPRRFCFRPTAELEALQVFPGQERTIQAVRFGLSIRHEGYNLFALGPMGVGKLRLVRHFTQVQAAHKLVGYAYLAVTDHSQSLKVSHRLPLDKVRARLTEIRKVNEVTAGKPYLLAGDEGDGGAFFLSTDAHQLDYLRFMELAVGTANGPGWGRPRFSIPALWQSFWTGFGRCGADQAGLLSRLKDR